MRPLSLLGVLWLTACITVNVYFPAAAAERAADRLICEVYGVDCNDPPAADDAPAVEPESVPDPERMSPSEDAPQSSLEAPLTEPAATIANAKSFSTRTVASQSGFSVYSVASPAFASSEDIAGGPSMAPTMALSMAPSAAQGMAQNSVQTMAQCMAQRMATLRHVGGRVGDMLAQLAFQAFEQVIPSAHAQQPDINISSPAIRGLESAMESRHRELKPHYASGAVGLKYNGLVELRDASVVDLRARNQVKQLVADENRDRNALYAEIAAANGHPEWEESIREIFARRWIANAPSGWFYEDRPGDWRRK